MTSGTIPLGPGGEFDRLRAVFRHLSPRLRGLGDDAALITVDGVRLAFSCDLAVEGRHFRLAWLTATEVGWRACAAALSDLAAVAAEPLGVLAAVGVPEGHDGEFLEWLMDGVVRAAGAAGAELWGGDLVRAPQVTIDVTVVGRAERSVRRRGARPGDALWVTGLLGAPQAAVAAWEAGLHPAPGLRERFAHPVPRIAESWWLRDHGATAMIDLSDGLVGDAGHLAAASGVRLEIVAERVPVHAAVEAVAVDEAEDADQADQADQADGAEEGAEVSEGVPVDSRVRGALVGGEEYELLVALPAKFGEAEAREFARSFDLPLTRIGVIGEGSGVTVEHDGQPVDLGGGFSHF